METKEFRAESKRLLEMMINSIYTHKEIFLRELISNASDAVDKLYFKSLTDDSVGMKREDFKIFIKSDKDARTLTITDNGIGMTKEELENNLGTIARSGSLDFKKSNEKAEDVDIIGQFGVGFYSAFMVAKEVTVKSRAFGSEKAYIWQSEGVDGYTIDECDKEDVGTEITLTLKEDTDDEKYSQYLDQNRIQVLVKKYSDYIRTPIMMDFVHKHYKEGTENEFEEHIERETLNSMVPIWKKNKNELNDDDYNNFYNEKFYDFNQPLIHMHVKNEGMPSYDALLYIPSKVPFDFYTKDFEKGLQLYSNGVLIMDKCSDLLPDHYCFVKGLVDSEDLSLNISREMLQHDAQLKVIAKSLEKTIKNELSKLLRTDREKYEQMFGEFGLQLKFGIYNEFGRNKDELKDLIMFKSSFENKMVTLAEYVSRMKEEQKEIYYAAGDSITRLENLPQTEAIKDKGFEILYMTDSVDEFAVQTLLEYDGKPFKSVSSGDLDLDTEEEKQDATKKTEENKDMFAFMQETLKDKIKEVKISNRLKSHPVCISSEGQISVEMEKILNQIPNSNQKVSAEKVLEINSNHPIFTKLTSLFENDKDKLAKYTKLLYSQALLIDGVPVENPVEFTDMLCDLMSE